MTPSTVRMILCSSLVVASLGARAAEPESPTDAAKRLHDRGIDAMAHDDFAAAATFFDEASKIVDDPILVWNAARAHHKAGHYALAKERYLRCLARADFPADKREQIARYLIEIDRAENPPAPGVTEPPKQPTEPPPTRLGPWVTMGSGLLVAAGGIALHFIAEGQRSDVIDARETGFVTTMTQVEAKDTEGDANTLDTIGAISIGVGSAVLVAGVIWLVVGSAEPESRGTVNVTLGDRSILVTGRF